jgi:hypothetical protein
MATSFAVTAAGSALDCGKIAAEAAAAVAIPEDISGLEASALERLIATLTLKLDIAKRVLSEKSVEVKQLRHVDSYAINKERLAEHAPKEELPALRHINSMELNRSRLPEPSPLPFGIERDQLPTIVAVGAAVLLGAAFVLSRRNR